VAKDADRSDGEQLLDGITRSIRGTAWSIGLISAVLNVLLLSGSLYMMGVYDLVLPGRSLPTLMGLLLLVVIAYLFQGVLDYIRSRLLIHQAALLDARLSGQIYTLIGHLSRLFPSRDSIQPTRDLEQVRNFLSGAGPVALIDLPWMFFFVIVLFGLHPYLGLTVLGGVFFLILLTILTEWMTNGPNQHLMQLNINRLGQADTGRRHAEVIHAMGMEERMQAAWTDSSQRYLVAHKKLSGISASLSGVSRIFRLFLQSAVLTVGALLVMNGEASGGVIFASSIISSRALAPVELAIGNWRSFVTARQAWDRLRQLIGAMPDTKPQMLRHPPSQSLSVESLVLGPPGAQAPNVRMANFLVKAGEAVAILGHSGCGKSSLVKGILGLWPARGGAVRLDGAALDQWDSAYLGRHIGYLPQNVELIEGTIAQNIARFDPLARPEEIVAAARLADVHELILNLPDGYNSQVGQDGRALSGGQRQRIALARALFRDPFLLVLDEPNSNLDTEGEAALSRAVRSACGRGAIVLIVAHRPTILESVDLVVLMREGAVIAFGPKDDILPRLGLAPPRATDQ
jgi:PrtD family type I secretion system ABC transporter